MGGAVEMCSGLGACRKKLEGTMCPSYMATKEEKDVTRGRANVLRLAMTGRLAEAGTGRSWRLRVARSVPGVPGLQSGVSGGCGYGPVQERVPGWLLADYGTPLHAKVLGNVHTIAKMGSPMAAVVNRVSALCPVRHFNEAVFGIDHRRTLPALSRKTLAARLRDKDSADASVLLFNDTFTNYYDPEIGVAAWEVMESAGLKVGLAPNQCCGRPMISKGLLREAAVQARLNTSALYEAAVSGKKVVFCEPGCLSAMREDAPALLRGEDKRRAEVVASACVGFEEFASGLALQVKAGPSKILLHGHCHQKAMGLLPSVLGLFSKIPESKVVDLDAGCCGMAGSFGLFEGPLRCVAGYRRAEAVACGPG